MITGSPNISIHNKTDLLLDPRDALQLNMAGLTRMYQIYTPRDGIIDFTRLNVGLTTIGLPLFLASSYPGANALREARNDGLRLSIDRPEGIEENNPIGHWAVVNLQYFASRFVILGTFRRPTSSQISDRFVPGKYAAVILLRTPDDILMGASCQFLLQDDQTTGMRLNLPGTNVSPGLNLIDTSYTEQVFHSEKPSNFTIALSYNKSLQPQGGYAALLIDQEIVSQVIFDFSALAGRTYFSDVRAGIATASGSSFTAAVDLIDLQVWLPQFPIL